VQLLDSKEQIRSFLISNLREHGFVDKSPMPSYKDKLTSQEIADVVSYLGTLKGIETR
jgi:mono/diheme cytochrome c family protein